MQKYGLRFPTPLVQYILFYTQTFVSGPMRNVDTFRY